MLTLLSALTRPSHGAFTSPMIWGFINARGNDQVLVSRDAFGCVRRESPHGPQGFRAHLLYSYRTVGSELPICSFVCAIIASIFLITSSDFAYAQSVNRRAEVEAKQYFLPCSAIDPQYLEFVRSAHQPDPKVDDDYLWGCHHNQSEFVDDYIRAKSGDAEAMHYVASALHRTPVPALWLTAPGIRYDEVQACAWDLVRARQATRTAPSFPPGEGCDALSAPDRAAASAREQAILVQLRTEPTHPLPAKLRPSSEVAPLQPR